VDESKELVQREAEGLHEEKIKDVYLGIRRTLVRLGQAVITRSAEQVRALQVHTLLAGWMVVRLNEVRHLAIESVWDHVPELAAAVRAILAREGYKIRGVTVPSFADDMKALDVERIADFLGRLRLASLIEPGLNWSPEELYEVHARSGLNGLQYDAAVALLSNRKPHHGSPRRLPMPCTCEGPLMPVGRLMNEVTCLDCLGTFYRQGAMRDASFNVRRVLGEPMPTVRDRHAETVKRDIAVNFNVVKMAPNKVSDLFIEATKNIARGLQESMDRKAVAAIDAAEAAFNAKPYVMGQLPPKGSF
jgi:hypothetical protein